MRTFDPWIGRHFATRGFGGKRVLILGESHYGGDKCNYASFTKEIIEEMALEKGHLPFFSRTARLLIGGRGGFTVQEREEFWQSIAFYNFVQSALPRQGDRPTTEMWQAACSAFIQTVEELSPDFVLVLGIELSRQVPQLPSRIKVCAVQHPSAIGFSYDVWQPVVQGALKGI